MIGAGIQANQIKCVSRITSLSIIDSISDYLTFKCLQLLSMKWNMQHIRSCMYTVCKYLHIQKLIRIVIHSASNSSTSIPPKHSMCNEWSQIANKRRKFYFFLFFYYDYFVAVAAAVFARVVRSVCVCDRALPHLVVRASVCPFAFTTLLMYASVCMHAPCAHACVKVYWCLHALHAYVRRVVIYKNSMTGSAAVWLKELRCNCANVHQTQASLFPSHQASASWLLHCVQA